MLTTLLALLGGFVVLATALLLVANCITRRPFPQAPRTKKSAVLVTGASSGIGRSAALALAKQGFTVLAGVRKTSDGRDVEQDHENIRALIIDVAKDESVRSAATKVDSEHGDVDLVGLVNNAGVNTSGPMEFQPIDDIAWQLDVNVMGQVRVMQAFMPRLRAGETPGRIVNVSSVAGLVSTPFQGAYSASKFALNAVTDAMRRELRPWRISVSSINPGYVESAIFDKAAVTREEMKKNVPEAGLQLYSKLYERTPTVPKSLKATTKVTDDAIVHAMTARFPKPYYVVGAPAFLRQFSFITAPVISYALVDHLLAKTIWPKKWAVKGRCD